jgi:hypothetical protein
MEFRPSAYLMSAAILPKMPEIDPTKEGDME